jgi:hypothetical protein
VRGVAGSLFGGLLLAALAAAPALANPDVQPGVAHVSVIASGTVTIERADEKTQSQAVVNDPIVPGDFISTTDPAARAELQLDGYTSLRLGGDVQARLVTDDPDSRRVEVARGLVELAVLRGADDGTTEIVTPSIVVRSSGPSDTRIEVKANGDTLVSARNGRVQIATPKESIDLVPGTTLIARGTADDPQIERVPEVPSDSFDSFNASRDRELLDALEHNPHLPSSIASESDLGNYGSWYDIAPYGEAWVPSDQGSNWAPYRDGQWSWEGNNYGWTWTGNESWGWIPYHYGSWFYQTPYGWCWYPPTGAYPTWYPAFVGFFGYGIGPFGFANFGWVPLAPFETFYPWYSYWAYQPPTYYVPAPTPTPRRIPSRPHHRPLKRAFRNARHGGATTVDVQAWRAGRFSHPVDVDRRRVSEVSVIEGELPMKPTLANMRLSPIAPAHPVRLSAFWRLPRFAAVVRLKPLPASQAQRVWEHFDDSWHVHGTLSGTHLPVERIAVPVEHISVSPLHVAAPVEHISAPVERVHSRPPA